MLGLLAGPAAAAEMAVAEGLVLDYRVLRDGAPIGRHRVRFDRAGEALVVATRIRITYELLFVTLYRFELDAREMWRDGRLVGLEAEVNDDGARRTVRAAPSAGGLAVTAAGRAWTAPATVAPSSLWHRDMVPTPVLVDLRTGARLAVNFTEVGEATVTARGRPVEAVHYRVAGDLERELWYDGRGMLVRTRFEGADGSEIVYVLE